MRFPIAIKPALFIAVAQLAVLPNAAQLASNDAFGACAESGRSYVSKLEENVGKFWHPPKGKDWQDLAIEFKVEKKGTISDFRTCKSSGSSQIDKLAVQAIEKAGPLPRLPGEYSDVLFQLHFESPQPIEDVMPPKMEITPARPNMGSSNDSHRRPSVTAQPDVNFGPFMAELQRRIKKGWKTIARTQPIRTTLVFKVNANGDISHLRIERSSGDAAFDKATLDAVQTASPFRHLPAGANQDVDIQFTFDQAGLLGFEKSGNAWVGVVKGGS